MTLQIPHRAMSHLSELPFLNGLILTRGRVHELCGDARTPLALIIAQACKGAIFWVHTPRGADPLFAPGLARYIDPSRLYLVRTTSPEDTLWTAEETLRSGQVPLVIAELPAPLPLTPVRRLHLAAQSGSAGHRTSAPVGLLLCPGPGGSQGVDSRWQMCACDGGGHGAGWKLTRLRARTAPPKSWPVREKDGHPYIARDTAGSVTAK